MGAIRATGSEDTSSCDPPILAVALSTTLATGLGVASVGPAIASPPSPHTLVVDDDGAQCGPYAYSSICAAIDAARHGDRVRVCPGRYAERVVVNKPLTLIGQPAAVAALNCFTEQTSEPDDLDSTVVPVLEPPDAEEKPVLRLLADRIEIAGLVIQGVDDQEFDIGGDGYILIDAALTTDDKHTGWRIHHNLFRLNFLAVELGSKGGQKSRFDHNCLRDNGYSVANQRYKLSGPSLTTMKRTGLSLLRGKSAGLSGHHRSYLVPQHLAARPPRALRPKRRPSDGTGQRYRAGRRGHQPGWWGINLVGGDTQPRLLHNTVTGTTRGAAITVNPPDADSPVTGLVMRGNTVTDNALSGFTTGASPT